MAIATPQERIGTKIAGKYLLKHVLGEGGMGTVFAGSHLWTGREVAIKLLKPHHAADPEKVRRFLSEAKAAAKIEHRHVVDVLDMGVDPEDQCAYLVLERLKGESLTVWIRRGRLAPEKAVALIEPVMDALAAAHARGIVHRDLKPDNIFLAVDPRMGIIPKVLDFGIAKLLDGKQSLITGTGEIIGTPWYMSPEQLRGEQGLGPASDVWSMGTVLYEMVSGRRPFDADNPHLAMFALSEERPIPLHQRAPDLSEAFCELVDTSLHADPERRPSMAGFAARLMKRCQLSQTRALTLRAELGGIRLSEQSSDVSATLQMAPADTQREEREPPASAAPLPDDPLSGLGGEPREVASVDRPRPKKDFVPTLVLGGSAAFLVLFGVGFVLWASTEEHPGQPEPSTADAPLPEPTLASSESPATPTPEEAREIAAPEGAPAIAAVDVEERLEGLRQSAGEAYREGRFRDAERTYLEATAINPEHAGCWSGLGASRRALEDHQGAVDAYENAVRLAPEHSGYASALAAEYLAVGRPDQARTYFQRASRLDPSNHAAIAGLRRLDAR